ncbi:MAG: site-specific DNA-methyltransferase [Sedimentisphaerales bacterium]|nr:site-specific DNA-methyltransferase [Sedimentisphaerales bacterium]
MPTLNWIGKDAVVNHHRQVPYHLLRCDNKLSVGDPGSGNLLVEGDNLLALKALLPYYAGQVKCIYIDPPYNTGNENWVYNDNVNSPEIRKWLGKVVGAEAEDLSRHDKWLCMMYPRLQLLHEFLREDGAIFISIDDNEYQYLRCLMNEIFGLNNFIDTIIWHKNYAPKGTAKHFSSDHDYILVYAKKAETWRPNLMPRTDKQNAIYKNPDNDPRGLWRPNNLAARNKYSKGIYSIKCPSGRVIEGPPKGSYWRISKDKLEELDRDGRIYWGKNGNNVPAPKIYLSEVKQGIVPQTIWSWRDVGHTQDAKKELVSLCDFKDSASVFITPKPSSLIKRIMQIATDKDSIILDSFAGSGTTGQAVLEMNQEDHGQRKFIMVEIEHEVCQSIAAQRLKRVVEKLDNKENGARYCTLGVTLFDESGQVCKQVKFDDLARHVFFTETGEPLPKRANGKSPFIGACRGIGYYLLFNGILGDKRPDGGNVLTSKVLAGLGEHDGTKVVYGESCRLGKARLKRENIIFKQVPYEIKVS